MKKFILCLLAICFFVLPINIYAVGVKEAYLSCNGETTVGKDFIYGLRIDFSDIDKNKNVGIWLIAFELDYDDSIFTITKVSSSGFKSTIYKENGKYYILSQVNESVSPNTCPNNVLYCSNYLLSLTIHTNKTDKTSSDIAIKDLEVAVLDMTDATKEYTLNDAVELNPTITGGGKTSITIKPSADQMYEQQVVKGIVQDSAPATTKPSTSKNTDTNNKTNTSTNKDINKDTNTSSNSNDSYKIDVDKNDDDMNYLLFNIKIDKKIINYGCISLGVIVAVVILVVIIIKFKDRKINKQLKNFDKF